MLLRRFGTELTCLGFFHLLAWESQTWSETSAGVHAVATVAYFLCACNSEVQCGFTFKKKMTRGDFAHDNTELDLMSFPKFFPFDSDGHVQLSTI